MTGLQVVGAVSWILLRLLGFVLLCVVGIAGIMFTPWVALAVCGGGYLYHRDRQHRALLTALRQRPAHRP